MALRLKLRVLPKQCQAFLTSGTEVVYQGYLISEAQRIIAERRKFSELLKMLRAGLM
jgi:hypothetical protein